MAREKYDSYISPKGRAVFPHLNSPDTKFKDEGEYRVKLAIPGTEGAAFAAKVDAQMKLSLAKAQKDPANKGKKVKQADAPYQIDPETGDYLFTFKMKASGTNKKTQEVWTRKPALFDAMRRPISAKVGSGSELRIAGEFMPFFTALVGAGVSIRMNAVQVLQLQEFGNRDAQSYGFDEEEGGFSGEEANADAGVTEEAKDETADSEEAEGADF